ncbi:VanZ family protein [Blastococcus sp. SYSU DS0973]
MGGALARAVFAVALVVSLVVLFAPGSGVPSAPPGVDKVVHLLVFAGLAVTGRWAGVARTPLAVALALYAVGSELVQGLTPLARSASVADGAADLAGVAAGLVLWAWGARRTR